ncbi:single-stranded DNA-binding protein [Arthrobacter sp. MDT1-65]
MAIPTINDIAGITADPELKYTNSGTAILNIRLAFNDSKYNEQTSKWETAKTFYVDAQVWEQAAERLAETLGKGDQVYVQGRIETQSWEKDGEKKSKPVLNARTVRKLEKGQPSNQSQQGGAQWQSPQGQPNTIPQGAPAGWQSQQPAAQGWGNGNDQSVPF